MIPHRARFLRGRRSLLEAHRREPHAPVADEARDVDADASRGDELEIFPVRRPIPVFRLRIVLESADRELPISLADRRGRIAAIPDHLRRDTLSDRAFRSEEHTSELQSRLHLVWRLLLEKKKISDNF